MQPRPETSTGKKYNIKAQALQQAYGRPSQQQSQSKLKVNRAQSSTNVFKRGKNGGSGATTSAHEQILNYQKQLLSVLHHHQ